MPTGMPHFPKCPKFNHSTYPSKRDGAYSRWREELDKHTARATGRFRIAPGKKVKTQNEIACSCGHVWWSINPNWRTK